MRTTFTSLMYFTAMLTTVTATPLPTHAETRLPVTITGNCADLFTGGRQTRLTSKSHQCPAIVATTIDQLPTEAIRIVISRRIIQSNRPANIRSPRTYRKSFTIENNGQKNYASMKFTLRGLGGRVRYTVRAYSDSTITINDPAPTTCDKTFDDFVNESVRIRSCNTDSDCGKPLSGTSCGCTRDHVARNDADTTAFYEIMARAEAQGCSDNLPISSSCDCPQVSGTHCLAGICEWLIAP